MFQIATSKEHTVNEVAEMLKARLEKCGFEMKTEYGASRLGDVKRNFSDTSKAEKQLGWKAQVELNEGLGKSVEWFVGRRT